MAEEIVAIRIIPEGVGIGDAGDSSPSVPGAGSAGGKQKGLIGGMGKMFSGVLKALGIGSLVGIIISALSANKGLMSVITNIFKMIGYLLKPITDVIMILLMPILFILKPIMILVNQVMGPFLKLAMQVMREGSKKLAEGDLVGAGMAFTAAAGIAIQGLSSVVIAVNAELLKMAVTMLGQLLALVVNGVVELGAMIGISITKLFGRNRRRYQRRSRQSKKKHTRRFT